MKRWQFPIAAMLLWPALSFAAPTQRLENWHDTARNRDVPVKLYLPDVPMADTPVVVFSPGLGGSREGYAYLGEAWSSHGYAVMVLEHVGSNFAHIVDPAARTPAEYMARIADVRFALDQLQKLTDTDGDALHGKLNLKHVAMAGHSYGAVTTQAMAGQIAVVGPRTLSASDPRIACAIIMSPSPPRGGSADKAFSKITMPLLQLTGTLDDSPIGDVKAADRRVPFDACPASPQILVTFKDGDHMVFSGRRGKTPDAIALYAKVQPVIAEMTERFLDAHLRGDAKATEWLTNKLLESVGPLGKVEQK